MDNKAYKLLIIIGLIFVLAVPTCYFIAERDNPNEPENLNEYMGYPVADTGQTSCWDSSGNIINPCNEDPAGYPRQDGFYANKPNARSFTGPTQHSTYTSDYTTKDNLTGLVWRSCSEGYMGNTCTDDPLVVNTYAWAAALTACTALNSLNSGAGYAGRKTWRLPTVVELSTLPDYVSFTPAIDVGNFPATQASDYWSSSTIVADASYAWYVLFSLDGNVSNTDKTTNFYVRCVSDGP